MSLRWSFLFFLWLSDIIQIISEEPLEKTTDCPHRRCPRRSEGLTKPYPWGKWRLIVPCWGLVSKAWTLGGRLTGHSNMAVGSPFAIPFFTWLFLLRLLSLLDCSFYSSFLYLTVPFQFFALLYCSFAVLYFLEVSQLYFLWRWLISQIQSSWWVWSSATTQAFPFLSVWHHKSIQIQQMWEDIKMQKL